MWAVMLHPENQLGIPLPKGEEKDTYQQMLKDEIRKQYEKVVSLVDIGIPSLEKYFNPGALRTCDEVWGENCQKQKKYMVVK